MQAIIDWLLERRAALIAVVVLFASNFTIITSGLIALQWAHRGPVIAIGDSLIAALAVAVFAMLAAGPSGALPMALGGALAIASGWIAGILLRATGGLRLSIQILLLAGFVGVGLYTLFGPASNALFDAQMDQIVALLRSQQQPEAEIAAIVALKPRLAGFYGFQICLRLLFVLLLAAWALGYARRRHTFGEEFRALKIGYVLGVPAALVIILALTLELGWSLLHNLFGIAVLAMVLQGLALAHRRGHAAGWHPVQYVPFYVIGALFGTYLLFVGTFGSGLLA